MGRMCGSLRGLESYLSSRSCRSLAVEVDEKGASRTRSGLVDARLRGVDETWGKVEAFRVRVGGVVLIWTDFLRGSGVGSVAGCLMGAISVLERLKKGMFHSVF